MKELKLLSNEEALEFLRDDTLNVQDKKNISLALDAKERIYVYEHKGTKTFFDEKYLKSMSKASLRIIKAINVSFILSGTILLYSTLSEWIKYGGIQDMSNIWIFSSMYSFLYLSMVLKYRKQSKYALNYIKANKRTAQTA